jgi:hypothetical protein
MIDNDREFYKKLVELMGNEIQKKKCLEELIELSQVIIQDINKDLNKIFIRNKVIEEMSHVLMTFQSLKEVYNINDKDLLFEINYKKDLLKNKYKL